MAARLRSGSGSSSQPTHRTASSRPPRVATMTTESQQPKRQEGALSSLNVAIDIVNLAKEVSNVTPATAAFGSVTILLTMIRDTMLNELDYVDLGLFCADICRALDRGMGGKSLDDLGRSVCDAINQLTTTVAEIRGKIIKQSGRNAVSRFFHARNDKDTIVAWRSDLNRILIVFNTELAINTHTIVADMHQNGLKIREDTDGQNRATQNSVSGESPPPPPKAFFGRDGLIEKIVGFAENLTATALIGAGGIGKTSIALTVLHDDRIKQRFGDDRRFIRCDKFPASLTHFLRRLSNVIGAGIENPKDLSFLRPFLSSKKIFMVLDNAESILDPRGTNAQEIYDVVEELSQLKNIYLCITSRISTVPSDCEWVDIPTLPMEAACDAFYHIYKHDKRSDLTDNILEQLEFHPLSITLLATVAHHNRWDTARLASEWDERRTDVLQTEHSKSLAATIELSLSSAMFQELGPEARDLLGVVAFFPQGVDEKNLDWLFPTIPGRKQIFDKFRVLSLTYRSEGFVTMLAPLRDHLRPKDPKLSPLLCMTKDHYFNRLSVHIDPDGPEFGETRWIVLEDVNVEYLLDIFTTADANSCDVWDACSSFINHLYWHKPRLTVLRPRIEELPDDHPCKPSCLLRLSRLFAEIGNHMECERVLTHTLELWRGQGDDGQVAHTLMDLSDANRLLSLHKEGVLCAEEALGIYERLGDTTHQARCLNKLAWLLHGDKQLDAAKEAASRALGLFPEKGEESQVSSCHRVLGHVYRSKGETREAIHHFEVALKIASSFGWDDRLFWTHYDLAQLFSSQDRFNDANAHIEHAKSHAVRSAYYLAFATHLQARVWYQQDRFDEAKSEALRAVDGFEKLGATDRVDNTRELLQLIEAATDKAQGTG